MEEKTVLSKAAWIRKLDTIYSKFIRLFYADANGIVKCASCGKLVFWKDADCGHYIGRQHHATRWYEKNTHPQCRDCNRFNEGNKGRYAMFLVEKYGEDIIDHLEYKKTGIARWEIFELEAMYNDYKGRVAALNEKK